MTFVYTTIGRLVVYAVRRRFGTQLRVIAGVAGVGVVAGVVLGGYLLSSRDVQEG